MSDLITYAKKLAVELYAVGWMYKDGNFPFCEGDPSIKAPGGYENYVINFLAGVHPAMGMILRGLPSWKQAGGISISELLVRRLQADGKLYPNHGNFGKDTTTWSKLCGFFFPNPQVTELFTVPISDPTMKAFDDWLRVQGAAMKKNVFTAKSPKQMKLLVFPGSTADPVSTVRT